MVWTAAWKALDELLRGLRTPVISVAGTDDSRAKVPLRRFLPAAVLMGGTYGLFVGLYAVGALSSGGVLHLIACTVKLPLLFLLTLVVTFPSLYVFAALAGFRLGFVATLRLLVASITVSLTIGASLGPILGFFTLSTTSYPFMVLLNVAMLGIAGVIGCAFLLRSLRSITAASLEPLAAVEYPAAIEDGEAVRPSRSVADGIFSAWVVIYGLVGLQMAWLLRPFIGAPGSDFTLVRARGSNVFESLIKCIEQLF